MKIILFDLGNTLEDQSQGVTLPGAVQTLEAIKAMEDADGQAPFLALVSDFGETAADADQVRASQEEYYAILEQLGIRDYFEPVEQRVTLSTEAGAEKPSEVIFEAVVNKFHPGLHFQNVMFITERKSHVTAARALGMKAVHFKGPGELSGDIDRLTDLISLVKEFLA
jgi:FMN phosphatase YigB (HAD superfamily)